jgi:hypothetical protein
MGKADYGQEGVVPMLKRPLIAVLPRIDTLGALTSMLSPWIVRFSPSVTLVVAARVCVPVRV